MAPTTQARRMRSAITVSLVHEARGGPFVYWDDLEAAAAAAARHGFDALELFLPGADALEEAELRALLDRHGLSLAALGTGAGWVKHRLRLTDPDPLVRRRACDFIAGVIDLAAAFSAPAIIGSMQGRSGEQGSTRAQALDWLGEGLAELGARAAARGQTLLYEPLNRYETNLITRATEAADFIRQRGLAGVRLLCDLFHMNIEEADIATSLRAVGPLLGHLHFSDSNRRAFGLGHTELAPIAAALQAIGYAGYLSAEIHPLPDAETAAAQTMVAFRACTGQPARARQEVR
jgi:sugar phosphate isomerase/epimerase